MTDDDLTGPWALALGTLAVGVAAITVELLRRRNDGENGGTQGDAGGDRLPHDADEDRPVDRGVDRR